MNTNTSRRDLQTFISNVVGVWQGLVQYNRQVLSVSSVCKELTSRVKEGVETLEAFAEISVKMAQRITRNTSEYCTEISDSESISELQNATFDGYKSMRQWVFMTCNEFGYFSTRSNPSTRCSCSRITTAHGTKLLF